MPGIFNLDDQLSGDSVFGPPPEDFTGFLGMGFDTTSGAQPEFGPTTQGLETEGILESLKQLFTQNPLVQGTPEGLDPRDFQGRLAFRDQFQKLTGRDPIKELRVNVDGIEFRANPKTGKPEAMQRVETLHRFKDAKTGEIHTVGGEEAEILKQAVKQGEMQDLGVVIKGRDRKITEKQRQQAARLIAEKKQGEDQAVPRDLLGALQGAPTTRNPQQMLQAITQEFQRRQQAQQQEQEKQARDFFLENQKLQAKALAAKGKENATAVKGMLDGIAADVADHKDAVKDYVSDARREIARFEKSDDPEERKLVPAMRKSLAAFQEKAMQKLRLLREQQRAVRTGGAEGLEQWAQRRAAARQAVAGESGKPDSPDAPGGLPSDPAAPEDDGKMPTGDQGLPPDVEAKAPKDPIKRVTFTVRKLAKMHPGGMRGLLDEMTTLIERGEEESGLPRLSAFSTATSVLKNNHRVFPALAAVNEIRSIAKLGMDGRIRGALATLGLTNVRNDRKKVLQILNKIFPDLLKEE